MHDMLVKLYGLPEVGPLIKNLKSKGIKVRTAVPDERKEVVEWVRRTFGSIWSEECRVSFGNRPVSCFIALDDESIVGFACFDSMFNNFFGPTGVMESKRGLGIGKALFLSSLHKMAENGYAYAIIGGVGPSEFYRKTAGAVIIEGSSPEIYRDQLKRKGREQSI